MTTLRLPYFISVPVARRARRIRRRAGPIECGVQRRVFARNELRRRATGGVLARFAHFGRDLLFALWALASLALWIVVLVGWMLG